MAIVTFRHLLVNFDEHTHGGGGGCVLYYKPPGIDFPKKAFFANQKRHCSLFKTYALTQVHIRSELRIRVKLRCDQMWSKFFFKEF